MKERKSIVIVFKGLTMGLTEFGICTVLYGVVKWVGGGEHRRINTEEKAKVVAAV